MKLTVGFVLRDEWLRIVLETPDSPRGVCRWQPQHQQYAVRRVRELLAAGRAAARRRYCAVCRDLIFMPVGWSPVRIVLVSLRDSVAGRSSAVCAI